MEMSDMEKSKDFLRVYRLLIGAAENRRTVIYGDVAAIMDLPQSGHLMSMKTGQMLGAISNRERICGRPMLSAVAVSVTNREPGNGFYGVASYCDLISPDAANDEKRAFWNAELSGSTKSGANR